MNFVALQDKCPKTKGLHLDYEIIKIPKNHNKLIKFLHFPHKRGLNKNCF